MNILTCIFSIIWDLGALEITKKIQVTNSLRVDDLFTTSFVNLGNPLEDVVYYLLIGGMTSLNYQDEFFHGECTSVHGYTLDRTVPMMSHDIKLSSCQDFTKLLHCVVSQPWENTQFVLKLTMILTYLWVRL